MISNHDFNGLDTKVRKVLRHIMDVWLPSATMTLTNKTITGTFTGNITGNVTGEVSIKGAVETAEHGAGAIGTAFAPRTYRYNTPEGDICTEIHIDLTGLQSKNDADDVIGLVTAAPDAYLGKYDVDIFGVIRRVEMLCLETPAGGDNDINLIDHATGTLGYDDDGAAGNVIINGGDWVAGKMVISNSSGITDDQYLYLTAGTGDLDVAYTAGQFIIRLYGHAVLS